MDATFANKLLAPHSMDDWLDRRAGIEEGPRDRDSIAALRLLRGLAASSLSDADKARVCRVLRASLSDADQRRVAGMLRRDFGMGEA